MAWFNGPALRKSRNIRGKVLKDTVSLDFGSNEVCANMKTS